MLGWLHPYRIGTFFVLLSKETFTQFIYYRWLGVCRWAEGPEASLSDKNSSHERHFDGYLSILKTEEMEEFPDCQPATFLSLLPPSGRLLVFK